MASDVDICNLALNLLGAESIQNISPPDDNDRAKACAAFFPQSRDAVLRAHEWRFAIRRQELNKDTPPNPISGYAYQYVLPTDPYCLRVLDLNDDDTLDWVVEGRRLLTDESTAKIKYVSRVTDTGYFDPLFVDALAARLAMDLSMVITKSQKVLQAMATLYDYRIAEAKAMNVIEDGKAEEPTGPLIEVR
jgi:hypothetical protein